MNKIPDKENSGHPDDALIQEHEDYMKKVNKSGIPSWMLAQYEFKSKMRPGEDQDLEEILQGRNEDIIVEDEEDITGDV